jgi:hypothetical protein
MWNEQQALRLAASQDANRGACRVIFPEVVTSNHRASVWDGVHGEVTSPVPKL